jgi:threonine dehydrogenase-like Zn-dependent dehydrogenase
VRISTIFFLLSRTYIFITSLSPNFNMQSNLPPHHRALVLENRQDGFQSKMMGTPEPIYGSAVVRVLHTGLISYQRDIYNGTRPYTFPTPIVGGLSAIARVAALGPDATILQLDQLIYVDCVVRGRDDPCSLFLAAIHDGPTDGTRKLMRDVWRHWTFAEFARVPLENCITLDEARLCRGLGYSTLDLTYMAYLLVPYGGLRDIGLEPGETIVIGPATGGYGGAGVQVAVAMGARVIAMGRNEKELARLQEHVKRGTPGASIETVQITGDEAIDKAALKSFGVIDAVLDLTPFGVKSTHTRSAISSIRRGGRCSLMGSAECPTTAWEFVGSNLTLKSKLMYEREDMLQFVKMLERGLFPKGKGFVDAKSFELEDWREALDEAAEYTGVGKLVVITP